MKNKFKFLALAIMALLSVNAWGETVTYTIKSTSSVTTSGTAPTGSSASFSTTYTNMNQLTKGNSHTFTLSGFDGCTITGLTVNCKTNASSGVGSYTLTINGSQKGTLSISKIGDSYQNKTMTVTSTKVNSGTNVTFVGNCTTNSLYTNSITITYTPAATAKYTVTFYTASGVSQNITEVSAGAGVTPPSMEQTCGDYTFAGWSKTQRTTEVTTATTIETLTAGKYYPTAATTLYPIYTKTEGGGSGFTLSLESDGTTYYVAPRTGTNKYFGYTTTAADALTIYAENNQYLYYYDSSTKTYFSNNSNATDITFSTSTPSYTWTMTEEGGTITFKTSATGGRNFAYNKSSPRFAAYTGGTSYPYEFTKHAEGTTYYHSYPSCATCTPISPTLSYTAAATIGQVLNPTLDKKGSSGAVTYSIKSGGSYASINASTGALTCSATGTVTVQATIAAAGDYCDGTATSNAITISEPSYTITATKNDASLGNVSLSGKVITATPNTCVGYANPAYTVTPAGKATVAQSGNTFTVSNVTDNVTVTINFVALTPDTYEDHLHGNAAIEKCGSYTAPSLDDATKATTGNCDVVHYHFAGWVTGTISTGTPGAPSGMITAGTNMNSNGTAYIAVWAKEE